MILVKYSDDYGDTFYSINETIDECVDELGDMNGGDVDITKCRFLIYRNFLLNENLYENNFTKTLYSRKAF
jgi:hypothetical protein